MRNELSRRDVFGVAGAGAVLSLAAPAHAAGEVDVSRLVRTALFVSDLEKSKAFYRDMLGLQEVFFEGQFEGEVLGRLLGVPADAKTVACILKAEGPPFGMIGLFHVAGKRPRVKKKRGTVSVGEGVLVFYATSLNGVPEKLAAAGYQVVCPPVNLTPRFREMTFYGPDDVLINLIERDHRAG